MQSPVEGHEEREVRIAASVEQVFALLDDPVALSAHMRRPSWRMAGAAVTVQSDPPPGHGVGTVIRMDGRVLGIPLHLEETVTEHAPPWRKTWATVGEPRLLVMGAYRMGFVLTQQRKTTLLRVWIDYALPTSPIGRLLGKLLAPFYARWCVRRMAEDAGKAL